LNASKKKEGRRFCSCGKRKAAGRIQEKIGNDFISTREGARKKGSRRKKKNYNTGSRKREKEEGEVKERQP